MSLTIKNIVKLNNITTLAGSESTVDWILSDRFLPNSAGACELDLGNVSIALANIIFPKFSNLLSDSFNIVQIDCDRGVKSPEFLQYTNSTSQNFTITITSSPIMDINLLYRNYKRSNQKVIKPSSESSDSKIFQITLDQYDAISFIALINNIRSTGTLSIIPS